MSRLNSRSSIKKTWEIRKKNGKFNVNSVSHLDTGDGNFTSKQDIAYVLADTFAKKSSSENVSSTFRKCQTVKEKSKLNFKSRNMKHYKEFTIKELKKAVKKCLDTAIWSDDIHYQFLKHLPDCLLKIFTRFGRLVFFQTLGKKP